MNNEINTNKIIVDQEFLDANPGLVLEVGDEYELPTAEVNTPEIIEHEISQEDLDINPVLVEEGVEVGDVVELEMSGEPIEDVIEEDVNISSKPLILNGKEVTEVTTRTVNDREVRVLVLSDGSRVDVAEDYYQMLLKEQE